MPRHQGVLGVFDLDANFRPYLASAAIDQKTGVLANWGIRSGHDLLERPLRPGDLVFFHATRQLDKLNNVELEVKSEAGEFLPGFYTTSGTTLQDGLNDSLKLGWYWYECPSKTNAPKKDWSVILFVVRKAYFESYMAGLFVRHACRYYLQEPRGFDHGGGKANAADLKAIEFANRNGQVMIFPDKDTEVAYGRDGSKVSLDDFVFKRTGTDELGAYDVIVGLQKPKPLDMRQQCWVSPNGLWHINHAERYQIFSRAKDVKRFDEIANFVKANS